ncbi:MULTISPECIES: DNA-3-methyladenine glycosylase I [unclassified Alteromonas]|uniref:DNA-3-methyladenine glycosylase I n=1 Tax=unclassified Alteromonas TaxID=2614992 RepID=UPI000C4C25DF|nr:DNA-3-methyladenine glycosylase I [Alteromonas sp. RKMC-009]AYA63101.1 DNA-3-methyladenine glycosylase I [Alteromonas sp. RKMC-009]MBT81422.1 3-methyladenine DNA glycosylase [Alteromonadaceae bacterium]MEC7692010.1 DNA-3-methyladenine glycosylase I [Pseudomonadota bacterium]
MAAEPFSEIQKRAAQRKGGAAALSHLVSQPLSVKDVAAIPDDRFLAAMTKKVFQSGFVWRVIEAKWPDFETVFFGFDIEKVLLMPDEMLEQKATDKRIVRNYKKVMTVRDNAMMIQDIKHDHGSFGEFVAGFGPERITELWLYLKKHGARLGGNTGPYTLRALGVDTFLFSRDVEDYLRKHEIIDGSLTSQKSLKAANACFAQWQQESGLSLQEISQTLSLSWGPNGN